MKEKKQQYKYIMPQHNKYRIKKTREIMQRHITTDPNHNKPVFCDYCGMKIELTYAHGPKEWKLRRLACKIIGHKPKQRVTGEISCIRCGQILAEREKPIKWIRYKR